jgi:hypothetical protein
MMEKDVRYKVVRRLIEQGDITEFNQIFKYIPKSVIAGDIGTARDRFTKKINRIEKFTFEDVFTLGKFLELEDMMSLLELVYTQYLIQKKKKKK